jgi:hypothetical protein
VDVTPIGKTSDGKALPNPNVLIELGWALNKPGSDRIIAVLNTAHGYKPDDLPFNIWHRRTLTYKLAADADRATRNAATKQLTKELTGTLRSNLGQYDDDQAAAQDIKGVPANSGDPSIWATASDKLEVHTQRGPTSIALPSCSRAYIRMVPADWRNGVPAVGLISNMQWEEAVVPFAEGTRDGDLGFCEEWYARYWFTNIMPGGDFESRNVAMWFDETGEFWVLHGTAIDEWKPGRKNLNVRILFCGWYDNLRKAMAIYDHLGASPVRRVETGLVGVKGASLRGGPTLTAPVARKEQCVMSRQLRNWNEDAQLEFLTCAYNKVENLFGLPHSDPVEVRRLFK